MLAWLLLHHPQSLTKRDARSNQHSLFPLNLNLIINRTSFHFVGGCFFLRQKLLLIMLQVFLGDLFLYLPLFGSAFDGVAAFS
jgi:hypothetical protein